MMRFALTLLLTACGSLPPEPDRAEVAMGLARAAARIACLATTPEPAAPLWHRLTWAALCPHFLPAAGVSLPLPPPQASPAEVP